MKEPCRFCKGTGKRPLGPKKRAGPVRIACVACKGTGVSRDWLELTRPPFMEEAVVFAAGLLISVMIVLVVVSAWQYFCR
jgi:hypothetical protein